MTICKSAFSRDVKDNCGLGSINGFHLLTKEGAMMTYSFICPAPCNNKIVVYADNDDDAASKLVKAGALRCRNDKYRCHCEHAWQDMQSISEENLKNIVMMCMQEEQEQSNDYNYFPVSFVPAGALQSPHMERS